MNTSKISIDIYSEAQVRLRRKCVINEWIKAKYTSLIKNEKLKYKVANKKFASKSFVIYNKVKFSLPVFSIDIFYNKIILFYLLS